MDCPQSGQYLSRAGNLAGLEALGKEALDDIRASFQCNVEYGVATDELSNVRYRLSNKLPVLLLVKNPRTGGGRFIEGNKRFYVLNDDEWIGNQRITMGPYCNGTYHYNSATILLHSSSNSSFSWCRNVLLHETIHSVSLYSRIFANPQDIVQKHVTLNEGITECLNGYMILKRHPDCYDVWKSSIQGKCAVAYKQTTRLFCSLAQVIGIKPIADFYLSDASEFKVPWNQFLAAIRLAGFAKFKFSLDERTAFREAFFREECVKSIVGFKKIYDSDAKALDFSQIN